MSKRSIYFAAEIVYRQDLALTIRRSEHEFDELRDDWIELLQQSSANRIFLSWDWIRTWWAVYGSPYQLYLVEARTRNGQLVALAPIKIVQRAFGRRIGEFLGQGGGVTPEYLDFIVRRGWESIALPIVVRHIVSDSSIAAFDLRTIPSDSPNLPIVARTLKEAGNVRIKEESRCPLIDLPETWDAFLSSKSKNYRKKIKEYENRCSRELEITFRCSRKAEELISDMEALKRLHRARWGKKSRAFVDECYIKFQEKFARSLLARDALRLYVLEDKHNPIAALYCFCHNQTIYYYQSGRDPEYAHYRIGILAIHWAIRESIKEGFKEFDLLTGTEQYKRRWASRYASNLRLTCKRHGRLTGWLSGVWKRS